LAMDSRKSAAELHSADVPSRAAMASTACWSVAIVGCSFMSMSPRQWQASSGVACQATRRARVCAFRRSHYRSRPVGKPADWLIPRLHGESATVGFSPLDQRHNPALVGVRLVATLAQDADLFMCTHTSSPSMIAALCPRNTDRRSYVRFAGSVVRGDGDGLRCRISRREIHVQHV